MKTRRSVIAIFLFVNMIAGYSQIIKKTVGNYSSELQTKEVKGKSTLTRITYYPNSGMLIIEDNLAAIRYNDFNTDTIKALKDKIIPIKFQTNIQGNLYQIFKENKDANLIKVEGRITINGISKESVAYYAPIIINAASNEVLMDFNMKFNINDFNLNEPNLLFKDLVELEIEDGFVLKME